MKAAGRCCLVLSTAGSRTVAARIARVLVSSGAAACVSVLPGIRSIYRWKGKIHDEKELLLVVKTNARKLADVERTIRKLHTYDVPEIVSIRIDRGSEPYLRWLESETTKKGRK